MKSVQPITLESAPRLPWTWRLTGSFERFWNGSFSMKASFFGWFWGGFCAIGVACVLMRLNFGLPTRATQGILQIAWFAFAMVGTWRSTYTTTAAAFWRWTVRVMVFGAIGKIVLNLAIGLGLPSFFRPF